MFNKHTSYAVYLALLVVPFTTPLPATVFAAVPSKAKAPAKTMTAAKSAAPAKPRPAPVAKKDDADAANPFLPKDFPKPDIDGTVMTPDDKPAVGARVTWVTAEKDDKNLLVAVTDEQGRFHFDGKIAWAKKMSLGTVVVQADGYAMSGGRLDVRMDQKNPPPIAVTLAPASEAHVKLLDPQGAPAAGAAVRVQGFYKDRNFVNIPDGYPGADKVLSAADGSVSFPGLPQGWTAIIVVDDPRFAQLQYPLNQQKVATAAVTEWEPIKLSLGASIEGVVTTPDGKPVPKAGVQARSTAENTYSQVYAQADENGHFKLEQVVPGQFLVSVNLSPPLSEKMASSDTLVSLSAGQHKIGMKIVLVKGAVITGHVNYRNSIKPASGVGVSVGHRIAGYIANSAYAATDASGNYRVCVSGGLLYVGAQVQGTGNSSQNISAKNGETKTVNFTLDEPLPSAVVHGIVTGQDGKPVAGADILCSTLNYDQPPAVRSGSDGKFTISAANSPMMYLRARKGDSVTIADVPALDGDDVTLKLQDNALASITGKVVDNDGKPITGAKVTGIQWHSRMGLNQDPVTTDNTGNFTLPQLLPGYRYGVQVTAKGFGDGSADQLVPKPGESLSADNIMLKRADSYVAGHVVDSHGFPLANAQVSLGYNDQTTVTTDKQGKFRIDGVAPGDAIVQVKAGDEWMNMQLPTGKDNNVIRTQSMAAQQKEEDTRPKPVDFTGKYAPEFSVSNWVNVSPVAMSDLKGKIIIIDMWGCCADNLFETQQMAQQFASHGVVAIGLNVGGSSLKDVQEHIAKEHLTLPVAIDKDTARGLGGGGFEYYSLIDRAGKIAYTGWDFNQITTKMAGMLADERKSAK